MKHIFLSFSFALSLAAACGSEDNPGRNTSTNASEDDEDGDGTTNSSGKDAGGAGNKKDGGKGGGKASAGGGPGDTCESKTITADATPPDMLIVLDKSLSMALTRWTPSTTAVKDLTRKYQNVVAFGLEIFPAGFMCEAGILDVPVGLNNADKIETAIGNAIPIGITPTAQSLRSALTFVGDRHQVGDATATPAYVVLVTDGEPNCPDDATPDPVNNSIEACQALADANVPVYVIGYEIDAVGEGTMNAMAKAGGTDKYFPVENQANLEAAFDMITKDVVRCEFELAEEPADPSYVRVTIDGKTVALDSPDGWIIEGRKVTITGGACGTLKDGGTHLLGAKVECAPVMVQ